MYKSVSDIRQEFLNFFKIKNHQVIASSSLLPDYDQDQTLLFTNAGMNQFKNIFLGIDKPLFKRVVTIQRCLRAGGKHNDLDNVGYTARHLTFFEMLGNFSFGDYFKCDAIQFAWELLTDINCFNLPKDRIWVTVHACDNESYNVWSRHIGIPNRRIVKIGSNDKGGFTTVANNSDNFWQMGNIGPCGPCSEIFYDRGSDIQGSPPGSPGGYGERYIEIWNLVFIQFNRQLNGDLLFLPMLSVDTGMGLERISSILQGVHSNYAIDIFKNLIFYICQVMKAKDINRSIYVIADHIRACVFLIGDGVVPSNEGQGYVLRRIIRRAILHGKKLGFNNSFFYKLVTPLIKSMSYMTDLLDEKKDFAEKILFNEENLFQKTLNKGLELLEKKLLLLSSNDILHGEIVFDLYNTYGFPLELTKDICLERNIKIDQIGFDKIMLEQKKRNRQINQFYLSYDRMLSCTTPNSIFVGYQELECQSRIVKLLQNNKSVNAIFAKNEGIVILKKTPFYGESGGQIGDSGILKTEFGFFQVMYTKKYGQIIEHIGIMRDGVFHEGETVTAIVDRDIRNRVSANHSAHHLLRAALFIILGEHVVQKGSLINDQQIRFDFSHHTMLTIEQINAIEKLVNKNIWNNLAVTVDMMSMKQAKDLGVTMLSNRRYDNSNEMLRVVNIGNFSIELCGGTHVNSIGEIGLFIVIKEFSIAAGIRRIEGMTGETALSFIHQQKKLITDISQLVCNDKKNLLNKIHEFKSNCFNLEKEIKHLKNMQVVQQSISLMEEIFFIKDVQVLIKKFTNVESKMLFSMIDYLKSRLELGLIIFCNYNKNNKIHLIVSVTKNLIEDDRINALNIVRYMIDIFGGKGGGRFDLAQAGIKEMKEFSMFISAIDSLLRSAL